jgi:hypothetical protein
VHNPFGKETCHTRKDPRPPPSPFGADVQGMFAVPSRNELSDTILKVLRSSAQPLSVRDVLRRIQALPSFRATTKTDVNSVLYGGLTREAPPLVTRPPGPHRR